MNGDMMQNMLASVSTEIETNVDIVFVIDVTGSMSGTIDTVKKATLTFHESLKEKLAEYHRSLSQLRVKVVWFRDYYADGTSAYGESEFMELPAQKEDFYSFVSGLTATGGGDTPETSLEALTLAMRSDFVQEGERKRHIVILFTDAPAHPFEERETLTKEANKAKRTVIYPDNMPKDLDEFYNAWDGNSKNQGMLGANRRTTKLDLTGRRLILFAPDQYPWNDMPNKLKFVWRHDLPVDSAPDMSDVYKVLAMSMATN